MAFFRINATDAVEAEPRITPRFNKDDILKQENFNAIASYLVNGIPEPSFNIETVYQGSFPDKGNKDQIELVKQLSYMKYGRDRAEVEAEIQEKFRMIEG